MAENEAGCAVSVSETMSQDDVRDCFDGLVEELGAWALSREKVLSKLDLRGAKRARKAASALRMLHYMLEDGSAYDDAVATILGECHVILTSSGALDEGAEAPSSSAPERSGRREIGGLARLNADDDELDDLDKTAPGLPRGVLENYLAEVRRAAS